MEKKLYDYKDIKRELGCTTFMAYEILQKLNNELEEMGKNTIKNRIPAKFFKEKYYT